MKRIPAHSSMDFAEGNTAKKACPPPNLQAFTAYKPELKRQINLYFYKK
jgi:hypothetical protein